MEAAKSYKRDKQVLQSAEKPKYFKKVVDFEDLIHNLTTKECEIYTRKPVKTYKNGIMYNVGNVVFKKMNIAKEVSDYRIALKTLLDDFRQGKFYKKDD